MLVLGISSTMDESLDNYFRLLRFAQNNRSFRMTVFSGKYFLPRASHSLSEAAARVDDDIINYH